MTHFLDMCPLLDRLLGSLVYVLRDEELTWTVWTPHEMDTCLPSPSNSASSLSD